MTHTLFTTLDRALTAGDCLRFTIMKQGDSMTVLLQPRINAASDVPKETESIRAALALPLRLMGSPAELDAAFASRLAGYADARGELSSSYSALLEALGEAAKEAKVKTATTAKSTVPKPKASPAISAPAASSESPAKLEEPPSAPEQPLTQPLSLL